MDDKIMNISGIDCYEKDGTAYLNLETVAKGLGFTTVAASGNVVVRWNRVRKYLEELGAAQTCATGAFIPENIFYRLAMKAKNETAEAFQAKIADEVIPSIRRHGAYMTQQAIENALTDPDTIIQLATTLKQERSARLALEAQIEADRPKVLFSDAVSASQTSILIGDFAKILRQNGVDIGQKRLFQWMRDNGWLIKQKGESWNMPSQKSMDKGLFQVKETTISHSDGHIRISKTVKVTGRGQVYFTNLLMFGGVKD